MQLWQQHFLYKQFQELQRQQRLQQPDQELRRQNSSNLFSAIAKQSTLDQLPPVVNGMPIHDASNYTWQSEHVGGELKTPSSSQMFVVGNGNWTQCGGTASVHGSPNGLMLSQDQGQALQLMGLAPQQLDHSLYGTPVSTNRRPLNRYPQFQGFSDGCADMMTKSIGDHVDKMAMQSGAFNSFHNDQHLFQDQVFVQDGLVARQSFPGKAFFGQVHAQNLSSKTIPRNFQQLNSLVRGAQVQEFQSREEQADWSANLQENTMLQVGPSQGLVHLDPTEKKLLFGTGNDSPWDASFGRSNSISSGGLHGNLLDSSDYLNAFPSVQSGSWSALMQSAVAEASSSDTGLQDEWGGLNFQQKELSSGNPPTMFADSGKQQPIWIENMQSSSSLTSKPFPLFDDADAGTNDRIGTTYHQLHAKSAYNPGERIHAETSHASLQQSYNDSSRPLDQKQLHKQFIKGNIQTQVHFGSTSGGAWAGQSHEQAVSTIPAEAKLNQESMQRTWACKQSMPCNTGNQTYRKMNGWNISESLPSGGDAILKVHDHESTMQLTQMKFPKRAALMQLDKDGNTWKTEGSQMPVSFSHPDGEFSSGIFGVSGPCVQTEDSFADDFVGMSSNNAKSNQEMNQQSLTKLQADYGEHASVDSSMKNLQPQVNKGPQVWESCLKTSDEACDKKRENSFEKGAANGACISSNSCSGKLADAGAIGRENTPVAESESHPSASVNQKTSGQIGRKDSGPHGFQFHLMRDLGVNVEHETLEHNLYSQGLSQMVSCGLKSQEPGSTGLSQFASHAVSNSMIDMKKRHLLDSQRHLKGAEDTSPRGTTSTHDSNIHAPFGEFSGFFARNSSQTSQNMFELLHKVDQSRDSNTVSCFGFSNHNTVPSRSDTAPSNIPSHSQCNQSSALQGIGLRLSLPSKQQSMLNHAIAYQAVHDYHSRHFDSEVDGKKNQTCPAASVSVQPLLQMHEISQRENLDNNAELFGQSSKGNSLSNRQAISPVMTASGLSYARNLLQEQEQQLSSTNGHVATDQSVNMPLGDQLDLDAHNENHTHFKQLNDLQRKSLHSETVANQSGQLLLHTVDSQIPPFRLASPSDTRPPVVSHMYSGDNGQHQVTSTASSYLTSASQLSTTDTRSVSQPSVTPGMTQQGGFSAMLRNAWTNVPAQQRFSGNPSPKVSPNLVLPVESSSLSTNLSVSQRTDNHGNEKRQGAPAEFGICSINSQHFIYGEEQAGKDGSIQQIPLAKVDITPHTSGATRVQESVSNHTSDGNSFASIPHLIRSHQQEIDRSKHEQGSSLDKQTVNASLKNIVPSSGDVQALGRIFKPSNVQHQSFSLLQQVQTMKAMETDPTKRLGKRLKGEDSGADVQQLAGKMPQNFIYGHNTAAKVSSDNELATGCQSSFLFDAKMLCFSSEGNENQSIVGASQFVGREMQSQDLSGAGHNDPQKHSRSLNIASLSSLVGGSQPAQIDPQMAPSWLEQYGHFKNGQILAMYNGLGGSQKTARAAAQNYFFLKPSENMDVHSTATQRDDSSQVGFVWQSSSTTTAANEQSSSLYCIPTDVLDNNLFPRAKKRKTATSDLLPWHKEITQASEKLHGISKAELEWAKAANRLTEKVKDQAEISEDVVRVHRPRRRLILTTQLMQQLLPAVPAKCLTADATSQYDSVTFLVAKLALGGACSRISFSGTDSLFTLDGENRASEKLKTSKRVEDRLLSKVVESFLRRTRKLESDLSRLEKMASIPDVRVECQDLEKFSIINRFAKFHGRGQAEGVESSSTSEPASHKIFPQRYVTTLSMPGNISEGVLCLSL